MNNGLNGSLFQDLKNSIHSYTRTDKIFAHEPISLIDKKYDFDFHIALITSDGIVDIIPTYEPEVKWII